MVGLCGSSWIQLLNVPSTTYDPIMYGKLSVLPGLVYLCAGSHPALPSSIYKVAVFLYKDCSHLVTAPHAEILLCHVI